MGAAVFAIRYVLQNAFFIALCLVLATVFYILLTTRPAYAQSETVQPGVCRAAIVFDRSGSVGAANMQTLRKQVERLFEIDGVQKETTEIAFWSFASDSTYFNKNYNEPFNDYVSSMRPNTQFNTNLAKLSSAGSTNYEHAFAYNGGVRNAALKSIVDRTDLIVFLTDGEANPQNTRNAARTAALQYYAEGKEIIGGLIGTRTNDVNYVLNGSETNAANTFKVSTNYNDLTRKLKEQIADKCDPRVEEPEPCVYNPSIPAADPTCVPPPPSPYSLTPSVTSSGTVISGSDSAGLTYKVNNNSTAVPSNDTGWSILRLVVPRGQSTASLEYGSMESYRDGYSCGRLESLGGSGSRCSVVMSGSKVFPQGDTTLSASEVGSANSAAVDDSWTVGTKLCYVFALTQPTENSTPRDRYSRVTCVVVGKRPTVHVLGGDLRVGSYLTSDTTAGAAASEVKGSLTTKSGSINKTFGSWVEYGIVAPGAVSGVASGSGFEGGMDSSFAASQSLWSRLTFANKNNEFGSFTSSTSVKRQPDIASYFLRGRTPVADLTAGSVAINGPDAVNGLYERANGDVRIDASTLERGKSVIIHVPNGTAYVNGNINYAAGGYTSLSEIPQFIIIAKNIVINASVTNIDGWLIGRAGDGSGGKIVTCDQAPPLTSEVCNAPLKINGPVIAKQLGLRRTGGSGLAGASSDAAETFNLRADAYLWGFGEGRSTVRAQTTQTIELPPRF
ncbi:VWA domain-containing protein [bacterium]|nr:MAG: VWA domain-containing protein [bacterium]